MFEARLKCASLLRRAVESIKDLVGEANFECDATGVSVRAMDATHVVLVHLQLPMDEFELYQCPRPFVMGLHTGNLAKMLKCASGEDSVTLRADEDGDKVGFIFGSDGRTSEFELRLLNIESEHLDIPDTEYGATATVVSSEFQTICRDLSSIGDVATIAAGPEFLEFSSGGDIGTAKITLKSSPLNKPAKLGFALRYLNSFAKAAPLSANVTINISDGLPIILSYTVGESGRLRFYLASKLEEDDI